MEKDNFLEHNDEEDNLPEELRKINPPSSVQECVQISLSIMEPKSEVERYKLHLAQEYFRRNILDFTKDEFSTILKNNFFVKRYVGKYAENILRKCVADNISFPIPLKAWFDKEINTNLKIKYLDIINKENNKEQLNFFNQHARPLIKELFVKTQYHSDTLAKMILDKEPENIFFISSWDDDKKSKWLLENKNLTEIILRKSVSKFHTNEVASIKLQNQLYKTLVEDVLSENANYPTANPELKIFSFIHFPFRYLGYLQENYNNFFNNFLHEKFNFSTNEHNFVINGAQYLLLKREYNSLSKIENIFHQYKDLLLENITENISFFKKEIHPFEFALRTTNLTMFAPFSANENFNHEEKNMMYAGAFNFLQEKFKEKTFSSFRTQNNDFLRDWSSQIIMDAPNEIFNNYMNKLISIIKESKNYYNYDEAIRDLEQLKMVKLLENSLDTQTIKSKKIKV